jgi:hypothetical protein
MRPVRQPSSTTFVVRGEKLAKLTRRARQLARCEEIELFRDDEQLLLLTLTGEADDPRLAWEYVQKSIGAEAVVAPVLIDETGHTLYPTGTVHVRFDHTPSDDELQEFATTYRLGIRDRNRYQPAQVSFSIVHPSDTYLPELVDRLSDAPGIKAAWQETKAQYRRY